MPRYTFGLPYTASAYMNMADAIVLAHDLFDGNPIIKRKGTINTMSMILRVRDRLECLAQN